MPAHASINSRLSVCHIVSGDLWAGAEVQVFHLLNELNKNEDLHVSAIIHNESELSNRLRDVGVRVIVLNEKRLHFYQLVTEARRFIRNEKTDIIHSHRYKENCVAVLASRWHAEKPRLVQTVHGLFHPRDGAKLSKMHLYEGLDAILRKLFFDRTVAVSKELYHSLTDFKASARISYIPNGIPLDAAGLPISGKRGQRADRKKTIAVVGRLVPVKNVGAFLRAVPQMLAQRSDLHFLVVGDGPERAVLEEMTAELGVDAFVEFTGHVSDISSIWPAIDIYVLCSLHEGLSVALLEAMAHGIPVVATAVGGNTEVLRHGYNGFLVSEGSSISIAKACLELLSMSEDRVESIRRAGLKTISDHYSSVVCAQNYMKLYNELLMHRK